MSRRLSFLVLPLLLCFAYAAHSALTTVTVSVAAGAAGPQRVAFTALHTYYMSPTGSDADSGTSPSSAWATPNHPVDCGDVIIAAPGAYRTMAVTSQPSDCPSTSGGIDGTGGVHFAVVLCSGGVGTCSATSPASATGGDSVGVRASNWAFEGWTATAASQGSTNGTRAFEALACASDTTRIGHIAFINDIAYHAQDGYDVGDCAMDHNVPGNGVDYFAVVGSIAQNANDDPICLAAIDDAGPANVDTNPGVHVFFGGNFVINNQNPACGGSDGEGIMFDTWDAHGYIGTGVIEDNIIYDSAAAGIQIFGQTYNPSAVDYEIFHNTLFDNNACTQYVSNAGGEIYVNPLGGYPWTINVYENIARTNSPTVGCNGAGPAYAQIMGSYNGVGSTVWNSGGPGLQNIFKGEATSCRGTCDPGNDVSSFNGFSVGANTYEDPEFADTADLLDRWTGAPRCSSYSSTTACMGWDYSSQTATAGTPIADLAPAASGTSGKGYQPPGACKPDSYYPTWLKGVVYLQWDGTKLWEYNGLVQKPCGA